MRRAGALVLGGWLVVAGAACPGKLADAQAGQMMPDFVRSRQVELQTLAFLVYGIRLDRGTWNQYATVPCPAFSHHAFVRYDLTSQGRVTESFLAVYTLDKAPAKDLRRPWEGGIVLVPLYGVHGGLLEPAAGRAETIADFNAVWLDERQRAGGPEKSAGLSWSDLAACYLRFAGEQPLSATPTDAGKERPIDLSGELVSGIVIPIASSSVEMRSGSVEFDKRGFVTAGAIVQSTSSQ